MTKSEFNAWKEVTDRSQSRWTIDEVRKHNTGDLFFYKGGMHGHFIEIQKNGAVSMGTYSGAIPHIGEACFRILHTKQFDSQDQALKTVIERAGLTFLLDFCGALS